MRIVVPMIAGHFSNHFGGADSFGLFEIDEAQKTIVSKTVAPAPPHEQGSFPEWVRAQGAQVILAGGMGPRAVGIFEQHGIRVVSGVEGGDPVAIVGAFLSGELKSTGASCSGGHLHACGGHDHGHE